MDDEDFHFSAVDENDAEAFPDTLPPDSFARPDDNFPDTLPPDVFAKQDEAFPETISSEDFDASPNTSTKLGAAGRGVAEGTIPGVGGLGAGLAAGAALAPLGPVAALGGGLAVGMGAGYGLGKLQDWVFDLLGMREGKGLMSREQAATDEAQHPYAKFAGELAPAAVLLRPGGTLAQRALGAGIGGGVTAASEYVQHGEVDPVKVAMGAGFGGALPNVNRVGAKFGGGESPAAPADEAGAPKGLDGPRGPTRDFKGDGEVIPPETQKITYRNDGKYAEDINEAVAQRDKFKPGEAGHEFWNEYTEFLQSRAEGKGGVDVDASLGPHSDDNPFTYQHSDRANDVTTTAKGVAADNPPAPQVKGAGNPVGAPMSGRIAQRPNEAGRDYRKATQPSGEAVATQESTTLSRAPIHEDVSAALAAQQPPKPAPQGQAAPAPVARPEPAAPAKTPFKEAVTATATAQESHVLNTSLAKLREKGLNVDQLTADPRWQAASPRDQAIYASHALAAAESKTGQAAAPTEVRLPAQRPEIKTGVMVRDKADAARKQGVLDAYEKAVAEHPAAENESPGATLDRARKLVARADELSGGAKYRPNTKPPSWQVVKAARNVLAKPRPALIAEFKAKEAAMKGADAGTAKDFQDTRAIDASIEKRAQIDDASADEMVAHNQPDEPRPQHEAFDNSDQGESAVYKHQHDALTNWLNGLTDAQHSKLVADNPDLVARVKGTQDPQELMWNLMDDLSEFERGRATFEAAPAEDMPVVKRTPIKTRDDLAPTEPGKPANAGKVLDKNSPEFQKLAAQYGGGPPKKSVKYDLDHELAAQREGAENPKAIDGTDAATDSHFKRFLGDEAGSVQVPEWMKKVSKRMWGPNAEQPFLDYGKQIGVDGVRMRNDITQAKREALVNSRLAVYPDGTLPTKTAFGKMYRAKELGQLGSLSAKDKAYFDKFVDPFVKKAEADYDELRDLSIKNKFPGYEQMPERVNNGPGFVDFMFRRLITEVTPEDTFEPITNKSSLSNWAASARERDWFGLRNADTGERRVYRVNEDGKVVFYTNHKPGKAKSVPSSFDPRQVGEEIMLGNSKWKVDNASIDELMQHGNGDNGKPLKYSDNPVLVASDAFVGLRAALLRTKLLDKLINDPEFAKLAVTNGEKADALWGKGNHERTILPQLKDRHMPSVLAWALNDLVKTGFNYGDGRSGQALEGLSRLSQNLLKPFYLLGPEVHVFNELDKFIVGSGYHLPQNLMHFAAGLRSVRAQDHVQTEIIEAGGNQMFAHAMTSNVMPQIAKNVGAEIAKNPWKYDPVNKVFGVDTKDVLTTLYRDSNKMMWWQSDVLYTTMYLANKERLGGNKPGLTPAQKLAINKEAVHQTENIIDPYVVPTTLGGKLTEGTGIGRIFQQFLTDPLTSVFGRFHHGQFKMLATMSKNLFAPGSTPQQRALGASQFLMAFAMANFVYEGISHGYQAITGNPNSEFEKRGITKLLTMPADIARAKKDPADILRNAWTPAPLLETTLRAINNKDFAGRKIMDPSGGWKLVPGQVGEFAATQAVSPVAPISRGYSQQGGKFALQRFIESNFGLKTPSDAQAKYEATREKHQRQDARARIKRPRGAIEEFGNWLNR